MIGKVKLIRNIGKFYNFACQANQLDWHKQTFLFAPNAYGKSTLVNVFRSLRDNNPNIIRARRTLNNPAQAEAVTVIDGENYIFNGVKWNKPYPAIRIFDVPYIRTNILTDEIEHEHRKQIHKIIIGAQGIILAEELADLKAKEKARNQEVSNLVAAFKSAGFSTSLDAFLAIPASEETVVGASIQQLEQDIKSKESETQVRSLALPRALSAPAFDVGAVKAVAAQRLAAAHEEAEKRVLEHIDRNVKYKDQAKDFIRQGIDLLQVNCPFCGQDLTPASDLLSAYRDYFDDAFRGFQQNLAIQIRSLAAINIDNALTSMLSTHNANLAMINQWNLFVGVDHLPDAVAFVGHSRPILAKLEARILAELEKKQKDPDREIDLAPFDLLATELATVKSHAESYNQAITEFATKANGYVANLPTSDLPTIRQTLARQSEIQKWFMPQWKKWAANYQTAKTAADDLLAEKSAKQKELAEYTKDVFVTYQARINELLVRMGVDFAITGLTGKTDERANESYSDFAFIILEKPVPLASRQDDGACFKNTLSEGDKSTLAFSFFLAALEKTPDLDKQIVIFDDPLSSLDENRRQATASLLLEISLKLRQLCVFTHKKDFLEMLFDKIPNSKVLEIRSDRASGSRMEAFDVEQNRKSDYARMVEEMQRYAAEDFGATPETIQGNIRKIFEVVLKTKYYRRLTDDIKAKKSFSKLLETLFGANILDAKLKPKLFELCEVTNGPHHGEIVDAASKTLTRDELVPLIGDALNLLERL
jgi:wobble nucleotide-excising tRNase